MDDTTWTFDQEERRDEEDEPSAPPARWLFAFDGWRVDQEPDAFVLA